jgi:hypothetical protein
MDGKTWPPLPPVKKNDPQAEVKKIRYQAELDEIKATQQARIEKQKIGYQADVDKAKADYQADIEREKASWDHEYAVRQADYNAYIEVATGQIERSRAGAQFVQTAAAAVSGAYVAILGLSFAVSAQSANPLPARGVAPTLFLGLSIALATVYLAYLTKPEQVAGETPRALTYEMQQERRDAFIRWTTATVLARAKWLQSAVLSLALGVAFLPVAYLPVSDIVVWILVALGAGAVLLLPRLLSERVEERQGA